MGGVNAGGIKIYNVNMGNQGVCFSIISVTTNGEQNGICTISLSEVLCLNQCYLLLPKNRKGKSQKD